MSLYEKSALTIEEIKRHLRIDHDLENSDLEFLKKVACKKVEHYIGYDFTNVNKDGETLLVPYVVPVDMEQGLKFLIAHLYENRGDTEMMEMPKAIATFFFPHKDWFGL